MQVAIAMVKREKYKKKDLFETQLEFIALARWIYDIPIQKSKKKEAHELN